MDFRRPTTTAAGNATTSPLFPRPDFEVNGLRPDTFYSVEMRAVNAKGRSEIVRMDVQTLKGLMLTEAEREDARARSMQHPEAEDVKVSYSAGKENASVLNFAEN